nr:unnamed protein product [Callosobruchus analis]
MDTAASTSRKRKHPRQSARYLSERELQQEAEKIMRGEESDESYIDFSDSGSQWEPNESSEFDSDLNTDNESEENLNPVQNDVINQEDWQEVNCRNLRFDIMFSGNSWCNDHPEEYPQDKTALQPIHVYSQFLDSEILELIVQETNRNAEQQKNKKVHTRFSRIQQWKPTDASEMKKFFGIILYMGLANLPQISEYWSTDILYKNQLVPKVISRNRFQLLLRFVHFADNETADTNDRLYKIREIFNKMEQKFSQNFIPGEMIVVDETMIPFKGRLLFRQYIATKKHKYGLKIFKLCDSVGYTFRMSLYTGQSTIVTDNYYTSPSLARNLLAKETHLLGTLRKNRRGLPPEVIKAKLKKGEITGKEHKDGFVVAKWKDKRDGKKISIKQFREETVKALLGVDDQQDLKHEKHTLTQTEERTTDNRKKRNRCIGCYTKLQTQKGRSTAQKSTKKVSTKCNQCNIFLCFTCFTERH